MKSWFASLLFVLPAAAQGPWLLAGFNVESVAGGHRELDAKIRMSKSEKGRLLAGEILECGAIFETWTTRFSVKVAHDESSPYWLVDLAVKGDHEVTPATWTGATDDGFLTVVGITQRSDDTSAQIVLAGGFPRSEDDDFVQTTPEAEFVPVLELVPGRFRCAWRAH